MGGANITRIGKYEVIDIIGRGGMGLVYRAFDRQLSREVAIKTLTDGFAGNQEMLSRFYREAAKTGALKHPNIVIVYDLGEQDGFPYIVMEYLSGDPLDKLIRNPRPVSLAFKIKIIEQVCYALAYAHRSEVVHRDVKPGNVIVQPDGLAKLLDFGIASQEKLDGRMTRTGHVIGTVQYMAPERLTNRAFDGRSDIFSTGILLFQLLTGHLPFAGEDYSIVQKLLNDKHPSLARYIENYPPGLDAILDKALAKDPNDRYATADEMADELCSVSEDVKREQVIELFQEGQGLAQEEQFTKARDVLLKLLKIDGQHAHARQLLVIVQQNLAKKQRAEQLRQLRSQAQESLNDRRYVDSIDCLEEALKLDPSSSELQETLKFAQQKKRMREQVEGYLRQADSDRERGDLKKAQAGIAKAMELDKDDSRVRAAYASLARRIEELQAQAKTKNLLESARAEIDARRFTAALELLSEAERIDASNPALITLMGAAKAGREQEQSRRILEQLQTEIALAATPEQLVNAARLVDEALASMPTEPLLLKFKMQLAGQIRESEIRKHVDEVVQRCRLLLESSPREALKIVLEELRENPANERLLSLQSNIEVQLSQWTLEKSRASYLARIHQALDGSEYRDAIRLLQNCRSEGIVFDEMTGLLEFARLEAERQENQLKRQKFVLQAQELMSKGAYDSVIELLTPIISPDGDPAILGLLEKAISHRESLRAKMESIVQQLKQLVDQEQYEEALDFADTQPSMILQSVPAQAMLVKLHQACERDSAAIEAIATAYAALDRSDLKSAWIGIHSELSHPGSSFSDHMVKVFEDRCTSVANDKIGIAIQESEGLRNENPKRAAEIIAAVGPLTSYASHQTRAGWRSTRRKMMFASTLRRFGIQKRASDRLH